MSVANSELSARKQTSTQSAAENAEDSKEMEEFMAKVPHSFMIYPGLVNQLYENPDAVLKYDEELKEFYTEVPFNNVQ